MKLNFVLVSLIFSCTGLWAQLADDKRIASVDFLFGYQQVFNASNWETEGSVWTAGCAGSIGIRMKNNWFFRVELGYSGSEQKMNKRLASLTGSDFYEINVQANNFIYGFAFTKLFPVGNEKVFLLVDLGQLIYSGKLSAQVSPYGLSEPIETSKGKNIQSDLGFYPGLAFALKPNAFFSINYGFIGLRVTSTELEFNNSQLNINESFASFGSYFSNATVRIKFIYLF